MNSERRRPVDRLLAVALALTVGCSAHASAAEDAPVPAADAEQGPLAEVDALIADGRYGEAEGLARKLLAQAEGEHGPDSLEAAKFVDALVAALWQQGESAGHETRALAERSHAIRRMAPNPDHSGMATSLSNLALLLHDTGDTAAARPLFEEALAIRRRALGPDHVSVAASLTNLASLLEDTGDTAAARPLFEEALAIRKRALGPDHPEVATSLGNLALLLEAMGDHASARPLLEEALAIRKAVLKPDHPDVARSLNNLAFLLEATGDRDSARPLFEEALTSLRRALGPDHPDVATSLNNLALLLQASGELALARPLLEEALAIRTKALGPDHLDVAGSLSKLAELLETTGDHASARPLLEEALAIRTRVQGPDHPDVAKSFNDLGDLLKATVDYAAAQRAYEKALAIQRKALGPDHLDVAESVNNLALLLQTTGDYAAARRLYEEALAIRRKALAPDHPGVAQSLNNLAGLLQATGDLAAARPLHEEALAIVRKALGPDHLNASMSLSNLALVLQDTGDYAAARPLFEEALAIVRKTMGPDHPFVARSLNSLAVLLQATGDFKSARPLYEEALAIRTKALGPDHPDVASSVNNLAVLLGAAGDRASARPLYEQALAIRRKALGPDHPDVAMSLHNLAIVLQDTGDTAGARPLYEQALAIQRKALGPDHPVVARSLGSLASLIAATGDHGAARSPCEEALAIRRRALGPDHPDVARSLNDLAGLVLVTGDVAAARPLCEEALAIRKKALGPHHPDVAKSLDYLARVFLAQGDVEGSFARALEAEAIGRVHLEVTSQALSEREALRYARARPSGLDSALSVFSRAPASTEMVRSAWNAALRSRALVLDAMAARRRALPADPATRALAERLSSSRQRLANIWTRGPGNGPPARWRKLVDDARLEKEKAERDLAAAHAAFRMRSDRENAGLDEVIAGLPQHVALASFFRYRSWPVGTPDQPALGKPVDSYIAFVLPVGARDPMAVPLGEAAEIDALVARWRSAVANPPADDGESVRRTGTTLRERAWDPIVAHLRDATRVIVVPDGALNLVNFAALTSADGRWLVETGPLIHHLSAERDLVAAPAQGGRGLLALGGPDFDVGTPSAPVAIVATVGGPGMPGPYGLVQRRSGCADLESLAWTPLPGADREAAEVARAWTKRRNGEPAVHLAGASATEAAFKDGAAGARVLHLATHGFFAGASCESANDASRGVAGGLGDVADSRRAPGENPLLHSGLALAGANNRRSAGPAEQDGVLTAEEIASLDLSACEWAVLSACGTGLGDVQAGEGVMGLQRAFAVAGARTVVMSLWSVDDEATRRWMKELYRARLERKQDTAECVREASLAVLRERRARGQDDSPFWWGAFVASGK